jgi:hypothetical protein
MYSDATECVPPFAVESCDEVTGWQTLHCHFEVAVRLRNWSVGTTTVGCPYNSMFLFVFFGRSFFFVLFVVKKTGFRVQGQKLPVSSYGLRVACYRLQVTGCAYKEKSK